MIKRKKNDNNQDGMLPPPDASKFNLWKLRPPKFTKEEQKQIPPPLPKRSESDK